jgi:imidazolonepropionase-like amidohydrolase
MIALVKGKIYTVTNGIIEEGTLIIEDGKIQEISAGEMTIPSEATIIDCTGLSIFPGLIDAHTHLGILEEIHEAGDDVNESNNPITPHLRALDAINYKDIAFEDAVKAGVTTVFVCPGSTNVIAGIGCVLNTAGCDFQDMLLKKEAGLKVALGENPKNAYKDKGLMPKTRMGIMALLRNSFYSAKNYQPENEAFDLKHQSIKRALDGHYPLRIHVHREDDICTAIRLKQEFDLEVVLEHGTEAYELSSILAKEVIPVVIGPVIMTRGKVEMQNMRGDLGKILYENHIPISIMTDHPEVPIQYLALSAALVEKAGLPREEALKAITINAAKILQLENEIGSLEIGKIANITVADGHVLDFLSSNIRYTIIKGRVTFQS